MPTDRMMLRLPENLQRFLTYESARRGEAVSVIVRNAIAGSKEYAAWVKLDTEDEVRAKREQARLERIAAQAASKPERIFDIKRREDIEFDVRYFQEPDGARVAASWGDDHTWESKLGEMQSLIGDWMYYRGREPEKFDRQLRTILATRERVYREAGVEMPELKPDLLKTAIPRCGHWVPLAQDCMMCADAAMVETIQAALDGGPDAVAEFLGISGSGDPGEL